jgi:hypothetical protein
MTRTARTARTFAAAVVAALALCATATAGGPTLSSGYGCALACIESAIVTPTASSATVEVKTSVPASVTVEASKVDAQVGLAAGPAPRDIVLPAFQTIRTVLLPGLEPATTYRIVVSARDMQGRVYTRAGTFTTREVKVAVGQPDLGLSAGLGCKADCIQQGTLTSDGSVAGRARLELRSSVPATFQVSFVARTASGALLHQLVHSTGSRKTEHAATIDGLLTGTTYAVTAKATDAEGRSFVEQGTFRTRAATALVTFHKVKIIADGDTARFRSGTTPTVSTSAGAITPATAPAKQSSPGCPARAAPACGAPSRSTAGSGSSSTSAGTSATGRSSPTASARQARRGPPSRGRRSTSAMRSRRPEGSRPDTARASRPATTPTPSSRRKAAASDSASTRPSTSRSRRKRPTAGRSHERPAREVREMNDHTDITTISVDEAWLREWAGEGIAALERLLAAHAAFDAYLRTRHDSNDGDLADED